MRLIDADELHKVKFHPLPYTHITPTDVDAESYKRGWNDAIDAIMSEAPTIERKTGKWLEDDEQIHVELTYHCSECGFQAWGEYEKTDYCGGCGARMET